MEESTKISEHIILNIMIPTMNNIIGNFKINTKIMNNDEKNAWQHIQRTFVINKHKFDKIIRNRQKEEDKLLQAFAKLENFIVQKDEKGNVCFADEYHRNQFIKEKNLLDEQEHELLEFAKFNSIDLELLIPQYSMPDFHFGLSYLIDYEK